MSDERVAIGVDPGGQTGFVIAQVQRPQLILFATTIQDDDIKVIYDTLAACRDRPWSMAGGVFIESFVPRTLAVKLHAAYVGGAVVGFCQLLELNYSFISPAARVGRIALATLRLRKQLLDRTDIYKNKHVIDAYAILLTGVKAHPTPQEAQQLITHG